MSRFSRIPPIVLLTTVVALALLVSLTIWFTARDIASYRDNHVRIFATEATSAASAIEHFLADRTRLVETYALENAETCCMPLLGTPATRRCARKSSPA